MGSIARGPDLSSQKHYSEALAGFRQGSELETRQYDGETNYLSGFAEIVLLGLGQATGGFLPPSCNRFRAMPGYERRVFGFAQKKYTSQSPFDKILRSNPIPPTFTQSGLHY